MIHIFRLFKSAVATAVLGISMIACSETGAPKTSIANDIEVLMKASQARGLFNGNVLIAKDGEIIYEASLGYANGEKTTPLTQDSVFNTGSIAKEFNAVAIMILVERGQLGLEDTVSQYLPDLPDWADDIQIAHLLQYTSGLPPVNWNTIKTPQDAMADLKALDSFAFVPGEGYLYSNNNVFLQREIVEAVTAQSFADFTRENILKPAGLENAIIDPPEDTPNLVQAFNNQGENNPYIDIPIKGWVHLTARDMLTWMESLYAHEIISAESLEILTRSYSPRQLGSLMLGKIENSALIYHKHHGSSLDYEAIITHDAKTDFYIILLTNNKNRKLFELSDQIEAINKGEPYEVPKVSLYTHLISDCLTEAATCLTRYEALKTNAPDIYDFDNESALNNLGYRVMGAGNVEGAIALLSRNVALFPDSGNVYDSLGEAYLMAGKDSLAKANYEKALTLNPDNENARKVLADIAAKNAQ